MSDAPPTSGIELNPRRRRLSRHIHAVFRRGLMVIVAICSGLCLLSLWPACAGAPLQFVWRSADGSQIAWGQAGDTDGTAEYLTINTHCPHLSYGQRRFSIPIALGLLAIPPALYAWGRRRARGAGEWILRMLCLGAIYTAIYTVMRLRHHRSEELLWIVVPAVVGALVLLSVDPVAIRRLLSDQKQAQPGRCPQCGYDLRATPDPDGPRVSRCPECGRETSAAKGG